MYYLFMYIKYIMIITLNKNKFCKQLLCVYGIRTIEPYSLKLSVYHI